MVEQCFELIEFIIGFFELYILMTFKINLFYQSIWEMIILFSILISREKMLFLPLFHLFFGA